MSTPQRATPSDWAWLEGNSTVDRCDAAWSRGLIELRARVEALEATQHAHVDLSHLSDADREAAMTELRAASADARPTVKAPITRDRDETGDYLIIHDASPSTSSLVERVAGAMGSSSQQAMDAGELPYGSACAAIREVAAWLRDRGGYPMEWAWVAQILEKEADR